MQQPKYKVGPFSPCISSSRSGVYNGRCERSADPGWPHQWQWVGVWQEPGGGSWPSESALVCYWGGGRPGWVALTRRSKPWPIFTACITFPSRIGPFMKYSCDHFLLKQDRTRLCYSPFIYFFTQIQKYSEFKITAQHFVSDPTTCLTPNYLLPPVCTCSRPAPVVPVPLTALPPLASLLSAPTVSVPSA